MGGTKEKKKGGCLSTILGFIIVMALIGSFLGKDKAHDDNNSGKKVEPTSTVVKTSSNKEKDDTGMDEKDIDDQKEIKRDKEEKPKPVAVENSDILYYMDLYENYKQYEDKYVTVSVPVHYASEDSVSIKGDITGVTGMISITLLEPRNDLKEGDFITVTGRIDGKSLGYLYMKDANISATGSEPAGIYNQQKAEYDAKMQQKNENDKAEFINSCQRYGYDDLVRYPDTYKDSPIIDTVVVEQVMPGGFLSSEGYRCYEYGTENEIVLIDDRENKEPKFIEGDVVTVYGTYYGTSKMTRLLTREKISVPCIEFQYFDFN